VTGNDVISHPSVDYIVKPFNAQTLKTKIESVLAEAR
jgi:DNA-binding response OmpR family regulator